MKKCTRCKETKPRTSEYFSLWSRSKDGFRGWCKSCTRFDNYNRYWKDKTPRLSEFSGSTYLQCHTCSERKPLTNKFFRPRKQGKLGFLGICLECSISNDKKEYIKLKIKSPDKLRNTRKRSDGKRYNSSKRKQYRKRYSRQFYLMGTYNITLEDYEELKAHQNNKCAICGGSGKGKLEILDIDHDHKTGKIRGLLCNKCNSGLGMFQDDLEILKTAVNYLEKGT